MARRKNKIKKAKLTIETNVQTWPPDNLYEYCRQSGRASPELHCRRWWPCAHSPDYYHDFRVSSKDLWNLHSGFHKWMEYTRECRVRERLEVIKEELMVKSCAPHRIDQI
jgi:hypothetical protein